MAVSAFTDILSEIYVNLSEKSLWRTFLYICNEQTSKKVLKKVQKNLEN